MKKTIIATIFLASLILFASMPLSLAAGEFDWSDNFDDGNSEGWTVSSGSVAVNGDNQLEIMTIGTGIPAGIEHQSNMTNGTWAFDLIIGDYDDGVELIQIYFMKDEPGYFTGLAIGLEIFSGNVEIGRASGSGWTEWDSWTVPGGILASYHIEVIHITETAFEVYVNGSLVIETIGLVPVGTYDYFQFGGTPGTMMDNITVTEYVPPDPTTPTTPESTTDTTSDTTSDTTTDDGGEGGGVTLDPTLLLVVGAGVAIVVVLVIVVKMRS